MRERPKLRAVGPDERAVPDGDLQAVIDDLVIAHGHVVEASAEAAEVPDVDVELIDTLFVADAAVTKALRTARLAKARL